MGFFVLKGSVSLVAVALLLWHMRTVKRGALTLGRWLRYLSLLFFALLIAGASIDQMQSDAPVNWYNVGGLVGAFVLILAAAVSLLESRTIR